MSSAYRHLALAEVRPGMVLSDVLLDQQGQVLVPQGAILTAAMIALLPRHGVEMLAVLCAGGAPAPDHAALQARLDHLFRKDNGDSATRTLRHHMESYRFSREIEK